MSNCQLWFNKLYRQLTREEHKEYHKRQAKLRAEKKKNKRKKMQYLAYRRNYINEINRHNFKSN